MRVIGEVERWQGSEAELRARLEEVDLPLVIPGGARGWPASARWNVDYLKELVGQVTISYKQSSTHQHPDFHQPTLAGMFAKGTSTFADFFDHITRGPAGERTRRLFTGDEHFILRRRDGETSIAPELEPLLRDVVIPAWIAPERLYSVWGWFSAAGVRTWLHYDNNGCHNLNAQLLGRKEALLFAPAELARLYPFPIGGKNPAYNCCAVDVEAPDLARHPDFTHAGALHAVIEAGDLLFIPVWWVHTFTHLGAFNANVNFWWKPEQARHNPVSERERTLAALPKS